MIYVTANVVEGNALFTLISPLQDIVICSVLNVNTYIPLCLLHYQEGTCYIAKVPFRGAPCSDAAGKQKTYKWIMKQVNVSLSGRLWDNEQRAPYFNYKVSCLYFIVQALILF